MKTHSTKLYYSLAFLLLLPITAFAFNLGVGTDSNFKDTIYYIIDTLDVLIPVLSGLAFLVFFWGLSKFILNSNKPEEIKKGRNYMFWGAIVLFVLLSFRAIIGFLSDQLELGANPPTVPVLKTSATPTP